MSKSMKVLYLAGVLSLAVASAAQAGGNGGANGGDVRSHASAAPACGDQCPVLAGDGGPSGAGENNGHSMASATARSGQVLRLWRPMLAGGHSTSGDFHASAAPACDTNRCPVLATNGPGNPGDNNGRSGARVATDGPPPGSGSGNGRSSAALSQGGGEYRVAGGHTGGGGEV